MTNKERLIQLMTKRDDLLENLNISMIKLSKFSDYLLANGVVVPPCKVGTKHNHLSFIAVDEEKSKEKRRPYYILRCDCGNIKSIRRDLWESGNTKACGCLYETHGQAKGEHSRLYNIYHGMRKRCYNENHKSYKYYGGRGIKVCTKWLLDFKSFYEWSMANGYNDNLTIERVDPNGDYCPENCKWVTMEEQHKNTRKIVPVKITETGEVFLSIVDCARYLHGNAGNVSRCLNGKLKSYKGFHFEKLTREEAEKGTEGAYPWHLTTNKNASKQP